METASADFVSLYPLYNSVIPAFAGMTEEVRKTFCLYNNVRPQ
jgi:hypothetical protein